MKVLKLGLFMVVLILASCGGVSNEPATAQGFGAIEKEIKNKFGDQAYFTDLTIMQNETIGNIISVTVAEEPESLKMGEWSHSQGSWVQNSDVTIELPEGTKATDFMFQLNDKINLTKLGELVEKSRQQLIDEKDLDNPVLEMAFVRFPDNGDMAKTDYVVRLEPEHGGTDFTFTYKLDGTFIELDY